MKYERAIYSWHKKTKRNECTCICRKNVIHFQKTVGSIYCDGSNYFPAFGILSVSFFKAGCKLVSLSRMAFPAIFFMWRPLRYLSRVCSSLLGWNFAQQHTSWESPVVWLNFSPDVWKTLAARDQKVRLSALRNYAKDFTIAYEAD